MDTPVEPHDRYCTGCQILGLLEERDQLQAKLSSFQHLGGGVYRVGAPRRSAITGRYLIEEPLTSEADRV